MSKENGSAKQREPNASECILNTTALRVYVIVYLNGRKDICVKTLFVKFVLINMNTVLIKTQQAIYLRSSWVIMNFDCTWAIATMKPSVHILIRNAFQLSMILFSIQTLSLSEESLFLL